MAKIIELKPIEESQKDYDALQERLRKFFLEHLYKPLMWEIGVSPKTLKNAKSGDPLMDALFKGDVTYSAGSFRGKFSSGVSKALRELGATFDRKTQAYKLPLKEIPTQMKQAISAGDLNFQRQMAKLDKTLASITPEAFAAKFKCADLFERTLWKADKSFQKNVENISVAPKLTQLQRDKISQEWQDNMQLYIRDWTEEQIKDMRKEVYELMTSGARRESLIPPILKITRTIQDSHEEALKKAKFLAHQESRLMLQTFKQTRYEAAGSKSYIWRCVHRPHDATPKQHTPGNVRYTHGLLNGTEQQWSSPPVTSNPGESTRRNHPGQDYNCRCFSRPLIRKEE